MAAELLALERRLTDEIVTELRTMLKRRGDALDTFNIVLFGRTGTGKSCLIEALTGRDGRSISPGRSDHTQTVKVTSWESCRLYDTPGIEGWGRGGNPEVLEKRAREAISVADIVLLCFDSAGQQAGEFAKVAAWIAAFGKPVVAVLNDRGAMWRHMAAPTTPTQRARLSRSVAEHAGHIRAELAATKLRDVPIIAISSLRAVFARAREPYRGPDPEALAAQRQRFGTAALLEWSNLPVLEELLITSVEAGAVQLRFAALVRQMAGAFESAGRRLHAELQEPSREPIEPIENGVERLLGLLGLPDERAESGRSLTDAERKLRTYLAQLEKQRGARFEVPVQGRAMQHGENLISARLAPLREQALKNAEALIVEAMTEHREVPSSEFTRRVFDEAAFERAAKDVSAQIVRYLSEEESLTVRDVRADITWQAGGAAVHGAAGRVLRWVGLIGAPASSLAGIGAGALLTNAVITFAAVNAWNPPGGRSPQRLWSGP